MSSLDKFDNHFAANKPTEVSTHIDEHHNVSPFHIELNADQQRQLAEVGGAIGIGAVILGGAKYKAIMETLPELEEAAATGCASFAKMIRANPKMDFIDLGNGVECSLARDVQFFGKRSDLISITDNMGNEVHMIRDGSRNVIKAGEHEFFDNAGGKLHLSDGLNPAVEINNAHITPVNQKLFDKIENSFWTGYTGPLKKIPNLIDKASEWDSPELARERTLRFLRELHSEHPSF